MVSVEVSYILQAADTVETLMSIAITLFQLAILILQVAGTWAVFKKAEQPGWKAVIPIYNLYIMTQIGNQAWWWVALLIIPVVNIYAAYRIHVGVAKSFGKGIGFGLGLAFLGILFFPLLGFGDYQYQDSSQVGL